MNSTMREQGMATEGNRSAEGFHARRDLETVGKPAAIACLTAAIESFLAAHRMSRPTLAEDICGMSEGNFSKVINGVQGDFWALIYKLPVDIRADFFERLRETEHVDPLAKASEQVVIAVLRMLELMPSSLPEKATRMARAALAERKRKSA